MRKPNTKKPQIKAKNPCEKYELAVTDYVMGQAMKMPKEELWEHLKTCKNCRRDFADWQDTYTVMKTEAYYNKPEGKQKMKESFETLKKRMADMEKKRSVTVPGRTPIDAKWEIGSAAETIYNFIKDSTGSSSDKNIAIRVIRKRTDLVNYPFYEAMGSLVTNEKVTLIKDKDNRPEYVALLPGLPAGKAGA